MKYRIIKHGDMYIPQYRFLLIWWNFEEGYAEVRVDRPTLKEAEEYIERVIETRHKYAIKETVKEYNV